MPREPFVRERDGLRYQPSQFPALSPATRKIASRLGSKANSSRISVRAGRRRPQFLHVVVAAALDPVSQRPPPGRAFCGELVDRVLDEICGLRVALAESQVPRLDLVMEEAHLPCHAPIITYQSCQGGWVLAGGATRLEHAQSSEGRRALGVGAIRRGSGNAEARVSGGAAGQCCGEHAGGGVVIVVHLCGCLSGVGTENAPSVLDESSFPLDRGGEEQGVEYGAVESLAGIRPRGHHEQRRAAWLRLEAG